MDFKDNYNTYYVFSVIIHNSIVYMSLDIVPTTSLLNSSLLQSYIVFVVVLKYS